MNNNNIMVSTLPIKSQKDTNIGMMIAPTIMDFIGTILDIEKNIGFNVLHTYSNKETNLNGYLDFIKNSGIEYDSIFIDKYYGNELLNIVYEMYKNGIIKEKKKRILRCNCGIVDMIFSSDSGAKLYKIIDGKRICNYCGSECYSIDEKCLTVEINQNINDISIAPVYLKKEIEELSKKFLNTDILVSKKRETGYKIDTGNCVYNIDIDFLWSNYFKLYEKTNQIYIASNHQLFNMFIMNYLSRTTSNKNLTFIASPYMKVNLDEAKKQYEVRKLKEYKALLLLYNLRWKGKECIWSDSVMKYLTSISDTRLSNLYKSMILSSKDKINNDCELDDIIDSILVNETRMQGNIKLMKKMFREGRL